MAKIKITEKEHQIDGKLLDGAVKPFGTSAHIPFKREHMGKYINVVVPTDAFYCWVLPDVDLNKFVLEAKKIIDKHEGKMAYLLRSSLMNINMNKFQMNEMVAICDVLKSEKKCSEIIKKIWSLYPKI